MSEDDVTTMVARVHAHLLETEELPIEREASRWIGEAEAVAGDLVGADVEPSVIRDRVAHVVELLEHVEGTGNEAADEHVRAAHAQAERILETVET